MIERYCTPEMTAIWSREAKYQRWLEVELAITEAWAEVGEVPPADLQAVREFAAFDIARCDEIERETKHDLMAFVRNLSENVTAGWLRPRQERELQAEETGTEEELPEGESSPSRWIHFGVTSYDVIDTALGMMMRDSCGVLLASLGRLRAALADLMRRHGDVPCIGRTHGVHAAPVTFGHKLEGWANELVRSEARLAAARVEIAVGKISGPVGVHSHVSPAMEASICARLGLAPDPSSTQIVARDRHAALMCDLAVLAGSLERIATELRNLQRTEILEVQEEFAAGQTGSSAMPHKRNPWNSETVCGLARVVRANAGAALESVTTWHERDLTNSSLERIVFPDTFQLADFMVGRLTRILSGLVVSPENMARNLRQMGDLVFSEHVMVALIRAGMSREAAYGVAQRNAARSWEGEDFRSAVADDPDVRARLTPEQVAEVFSLEHHLRHAPRA